MALEKRVEWLGIEVGSQVALSFDLRNEMALDEISFVRVGDADARTATLFRKAFAQWLQRCFSLDEVRLADLVLAVNEALANAAEFGYAAVPGDGTMRIAAHLGAQRDRLSVTVGDRGKWRRTLPAHPSITRGRGIPLMELLADRVTIERRAGGTTVHLQFDDVATAGGARGAATEDEDFAASA